MTQDPAGQNPLEALAGGLGGMDLGGLLQQAQQMQDRLQTAQQELADTIVEGSVAGGAVTVQVSGVGELTGVTISSSVVDDPAELEDNLAEIGDLIVAAFRDARSKADALATEKLGPLAGGGFPGMPDGPGSVPGPLGFG